MALYLLTMRLLDAELYAVYGERVIRKDHRGQTMEENYREIYRVYLSWRSELQRETGKQRVEKEAAANTALQCNVSPWTVKRARHFVECVDAGFEPYRYRLRAAEKGEHPLQPSGPFTKEAS